jgi:hypothetical protein
MSSRRLNPPAFGWPAAGPRSVIVVIARSSLSGCVVTDITCPATASIAAASGAPSNTARPSEHTWRRSRPKISGSATSPTVKALTRAAVVVAGEFEPAMAGTFPEIVDELPIPTTPSPGAAGLLTGCQPVSTGRIRHTGLVWC